MSEKKYSGMDGIVEAHFDFLDAVNGTIWLQWSDFGMDISPKQDQDFMSFIAQRAKRNFTIKALAYQNHAVYARAIRDTLEKGVQYRLTNHPTNTRYVVGDHVLDADLKADVPWAKICVDHTYAQACEGKFESEWNSGYDL